MGTFPSVRFTGSKFSPDPRFAKGARQRESTAISNGAPRDAEDGNRPSRCRAFHHADGLAVLALTARRPCYLPAISTCASRGLMTKSNGARGPRDRAAFHHLAHHGRLGRGWRAGFRKSLDRPVRRSQPPRLPHADQYPNWKTGFRTDQLVLLGSLRRSSCRRAEDFGP